MEPKYANQFEWTLPLLQLSGYSLLQSLKPTRTEHQQKTQHMPFGLFFNLDFSCRRFSLLQI